MFSQFSTRLYEKIIDADYQLLSINGTDISDTTHWVAHKVEMSTPITLHVVSAEIISFPSLVLYDNETKQSMEVGTNIYILVGRNVPEFVGAEEYFGQSVYSIYWHVNLDTGEITVPQGQPKKLFNLHTILESTLHDNKSFSMAPRPHAKHRYPILAYGLIFVNLVILLLMYLDGYRLGDITVPIRFGAVIADFVVRGGEWWRLVAAMFIHFGFGHFFANSFGILVFGTRLERYLGRRLFFIAYIFSGLAGSAVSLVNLHFFQPFAVSAG
ncbi:MAG: rhomboid family intramembrane serine protease, partial [Defluviitaleaceae bacterium]|nr:rhomboid family intramembrane serine protease [Defluviitaleaceae bacterium]